jgi:hypothetical protein
MSVVAWHTFPVRPPAPEAPEAPRTFIEDVPFYSQLKADERILKNNVDMLARLLQANRWNADTSTRAGDLAIMQDYERVYGITLTTEQKKSARNMYMYVARLMTPSEIVDALYSIGAAEDIRDAFFTNNRKNEEEQQPQYELDRAGMRSYSEHTSRGGAPDIYRGPVRRVPASSKDRSKSAGLDPTKHWGIEIELDPGGRELMACCARPAYGRGSIEGCWIQVDKTKAFGIIEPYTVLGKVDAWQELSVGLLQPDQKLLQLFLADVSTGTAFLGTLCLDKDHYTLLDTQIRRRWANVTPMLVAYYEQYMAVLDAAIQNGHAKLSDPASLVSDAFLEQAGLLGRLIYQYNKPQEEDRVLLDVNDFINRRLFKVSSALEHFNEKTRGFVLIDNNKVVLLNGRNRVVKEWKSFLQRVANFPGKDAISAGLDAFDQAITQDKRVYTPRHAQIMPVVNELGGGVGHAAHAAYQAFQSKKGQMQAVLNAAMKQVALNFSAGGGTDALPIGTALAALDSATIVLVNAFAAITEEAIDIASAKKDIASGNVFAVKLGNNKTVDLLNTLEFDLVQATRKKRAAIVEMEKASADVQLRKTETDQINLLKSELLRLENTNKQLLLAAARDQQLLAALANKPAGLAVVTRTVETSSIVLLRQQLAAIEAINVDDVAAQVLVYANQTRTERQKALAEERRLAAEQQLLAEAERQRAQRVLDKQRAEERAADAIAAQRRLLSPLAAAWINNKKSSDAFINGAAEGLTAKVTAQNDNGLLKLVDNPLMSIEDQQFLVANKLLTSFGALPARFEVGLEALTASDQYRGLLLATTKTLSDREKDTVQATWVLFIDWLFYRGTTKEGAKRRLLEQTLAAYTALIPVQPTIVERVLGDPFMLKDHADELARIAMPPGANLPMFYRGRIGWEGKSCWMDSAFTALFSYVLNPVAREILLATRGNHFVRDITFADGRFERFGPCTDAKMQALHGAIVQDILQMQDSVPNVEVCSLLSREKWDSCVLGQPAKVGDYYEIETVFKSLKVLYGLKTLEANYINKPPIVMIDEDTALPIDFELEAPTNVDPAVMVWASYTGYTTKGIYGYRSVSPLEEENAEFVLGAIVRGSSDHFVTNLRDFYTRNWYYIDVTPTNGSQQEVRQIGPDLGRRVHHFANNPDEGIIAPTYKPCVYLYFRKSMLIELLKLKPSGLMRDTAILALGGVVSPYEPFRDALARNDTNKLTSLMNAATVDNKTRANMALIFKELDLVVVSSPYEPFRDALARKNTNELSRLMNAETVDNKTRASMDLVFRALDLVAVPTLRELEVALRTGNSEVATKIMAQPIQYRTAIGTTLEKLDLLQ